MVALFTLRRLAGRGIAFALPLLIASVSAASAGEFAQTPSFEGSYMALFGVIGAFLLIAWLCIRITFRTEARDRHGGRPDLTRGGFLGDVVDDDDDDHVHVPH